MAKTLREEVEALAKRWLVESSSTSSDFSADCCAATEGHAIAKCAVEIKKILARHPPADGVLVPRDLLSDMAEDCVSYASYIGEHKRTVESRIAQADAILSSTEGKRP